MGYHARNDEIRDNVMRMRREWEAQRGALAVFALSLGIPVNLPWLRRRFG
jgi:hypothetical protein